AVPAVPACPSRRHRPDRPDPRRGDRRRHPGVGRHAPSPGPGVPAGGRGGARRLRARRLLRPDREARRRGARQAADEDLPGHALRHRPDLRGGHPLHHRALRGPRGGLDDLGARTGAGGPGQSADQLADRHGQGRQHLRQRAPAGRHVRHLGREDLGRLLRGARLAALLQLRRPPREGLGQHLPPRPRAPLPLLGRGDGADLVLDQPGRRAGLRPLPREGPELGAAVREAAQHPLPEVPAGGGAEGCLDHAEGLDRVLGHAGPARRPRPRRQHAAEGAGGQPHRLLRDSHQGDRQEVPDGAWSERQRERQHRDLAGAAEGARAEVRL
ncbi:MAG: hypothetical protein AVDCRST_MAG48-3019, partial [uncultured Friedmanniella sp.]